MLPQKNSFSTFISVSLSLLIIGVAGVGFYTYNSLNKVIDQLSHESNPNLNLIVLKDIMVSITGIENDMESFMLTGDETYQNRFDQRISDAEMFLDSLKEMNQDDSDFLRYTDSLNSLISQKVHILNELKGLTNYNISGSINDLAQKLDTIPVDLPSDKPKNDSIDQLSIQNNETLSESDTTQSTNNEEAKKKKGFWKGFISIFSKNKDSEEDEAESLTESDTTNPIAEKANFSNDSTLIVQKTLEYKKKLQNELIQLQNKTQLIHADIRQRELELAQNQQIIQSKIIDLLTYMEEREVDKIKLRNYNAQIIAEETNDQVLAFSMLTIMLLVATGYVVYSYMEKNKAYQKILSTATEDAKNLARAKEQFLANMSHEIRTPMNAISGFTHQLLKTELSESQREHLDIIHRSSDHLLHILNDVLDFSKLQANKLILENMPYDLHQLMNDAVQLMLHKADEKDISINYYAENIPHYVKGDPYRFKQILINLVSNSIKFTEQGSVNIHLSIRKKYRSNELQLIVEDTGIGIPKDQQSRIMMEFEQAGSSSDHKGTGLGLSITKKLVELHNGKMKLDSEEGKGTKVTIHLPYTEVDELPETPARSDVKLDLSDTNILIADDEPFNIKLLTTVLDQRGAKWVACKDGKEAIEQLQQSTFDLAILDLKMPHFSGMEVAQKLRSSSGPNHGIPLIALTATVIREDIDQCIQHGFDHVLRKPFDELELFSVMESELNVQPREKPFKIDTTSHDEQMYDLSDLKELGDDAFVIDMLETFLNSSEPGIKNIQHLFENKNWEGLADEAHKIVAPARYLGATAVVSQLKALELEARKENPKITSKELRIVQKTLSELNRELGKYLVKAQV